MHDQYLWGWLRFSGLFSGPLRWGVATESSVSTHRGSGAWGVEMLRNEWAFPKTFANNCFGTLCTRGISRANIFIDTYILALSLAHDAKIAEKKSKELWSYLWYNRLRRKVCSIAWQLDAHSHHPQVSSISAFFLGLPQKNMFIQNMFVFQNWQLSVGGVRATDEEVMKWRCKLRDEATGGIWFQWKSVIYCVHKLYWCGPALRGGSSSSPKYHEISISRSDTGNITYHTAKLNTNMSKDRVLSVDPIGSARSTFSGPKNWRRALGFRGVVDRHWRNAVSRCVKNMAKKPKLKFWNKFCSFFSKLLVWSARRPEFLRARTRSRAKRSQIMIVSGQMVHAG